MTRPTPDMVLLTQAARAALMSLRYENTARASSRERWHLEQARRWRIVAETLYDLAWGWQPRYWVWIETAQ